MRFFFILGFLYSFVFSSISQEKIQTRSEYPRPQFERKDWVNLNGDWTYIFDFSEIGEEKQYHRSEGFKNNINVPFAPESKLSGVGYTDFINCLWYHKKINIPSHWYSKNIILNFGAVYYESDVYLDGVLLQRHFGGSSSFSVDLTKFVKPGSSHNLVVKAKSDLRGLTQSAGKQSLRAASWGCNYTRTTGIWQSVWLEAISAQGLKQVRFIPDIDQKQLIIIPEFYSLGQNDLEVNVIERGRIISKKTTKTSNSSVIVLNLPQMKLWTPESPNLYDIEFFVRDSKGEVIDRVSSYVGMRKIHTSGNKMYLNNKPYYQRLVLDQGFYPEGNWTAPTDSALRSDIELAKSAGFNGARLHQKVFEERFHYWADKLGYLTWAEAPSWGMDCNNVVTARNFLSEWREIMLRDLNHPSIVMWTPLNESWWPDQKQYIRFVSDLYDLTKSLDATRPINTVSGGVHIKTDVWTVHNYEQNGDTLKKSLYNKGDLQNTPNDMFKIGQYNLGFNDPEPSAPFPFPSYDYRIPYIVDEFGGIKWSSNSNDQKSWGYGNAPRTEIEFLDRLNSQVDAILDLESQIWGYCYTQLTDVEQEQNGIYYYDRRPKFDMKKIFEIFSKTPKSVDEN